MKIGPLTVTLIEDWRQCWKLASVYLSALLAALAAAYEYLPELQQYLPAGWVKWAFLVILFARLIRQASVGRSGL
ncbi:MAG: hypothetical protein NVV69_16400 [Methyloversatilis sp.]|uniref:DUF7940 domain-containing protein n=1 Tax=Methyloversatilis sp. TaxID=2569862 RepID=UPI0025DC8C12|nr:hypothetical protein [Methyloversatilis sp.]MCR6667548.1 hypothetical protein [Methyloversatilis sp.]